MGCHSYRHICASLNRMPFIDICASLNGMPFIVNIQDINTYSFESKKYYKAAVIKTKEAW